MKLLVAHIIFFAPALLFGQDFEERLRNDLCECIAQSENFEKSTYAACFEETIVTFQPDLDSLLGAASDVTDPENYGYFFDLFLTTRRVLIHECEILIEIAKRLSKS